MCLALTALDYGPGSLPTAEGSTIVRAFIFLTRHPKTPLVARLGRLRRSFECWRTCRFLCSVPCPAKLWLPAVQTLSSERFRAVHSKRISHERQVGMPSMHSLSCREEADASSNQKNAFFQCRAWEAPKDNPVHALSFQTEGARRRRRWWRSCCRALRAHFAA